MNKLSYQYFLEYKKSLVENKVNEAFLEKDVPKVTDTIQKYLQKKLSSFVYYVDNAENFIQTYKNKETTLYGVRFSSKSMIFRLNWKPTKINSKNIDSIDFWDNSNIHRNPDFKINTEIVNISKVLNILYTVLKNGKKLKPLELAITLEQDAEKMYESENVENSEKTKDEIIEDTLAKYRGIIPNEDLFILEMKLRTDNFTNMQEISVEEKKEMVEIILDKYNLKEYAKSSTSSQRSEIIDEPIIEDSDIEKIKKEFEVKIKKQQTLTVTEKFGDYEYFVENLLRNHFNSLIVTGSAGVGKSEKVEDVFKKYDYTKDEDYVIKKGSVTPLGLYRFFYENRDDMTIVFDDADSVFKKEESLNILKGCLDTKDVREISWISPNTFSTTGKSEEEIEDLVKKGKYPSKFEFTSKVIFITNLSVETLVSNPHLVAVLSRSIVIDITLTPEENIERIESNIQHWKNTLTLDERKMVLSFFKEKVKDESFNDKITSRGFTKACNVYESFKLKNDMTVPKDDWKRLVLSYL